MSDSQTQKRNLPSWMSSRDNKKNPNDDATENDKSNRKPSTSNSSKPMEGVVFVLSGFVNPERSTLRSQALEMGADYKQDWNSECTLLVCAFPNTPKFRQVEADNGTIVSKDWISDCYTQKRLVEIEPYLMHVGKPWRRGSSDEYGHDQKASPPRKSRKQVEKGSPSKHTASAPSKSEASNPTKEHFSLSEVKEWAIDDWNKTISWLESQDEKPEPSEIRQIAAEGILTCLQDAIDLLDKKQDIGKLSEQWSFIPRVVEELAKLDGTDNDSTLFSKEDLCRKAKACKQIYKEQLKSSDDDSPTKKKMQKTDKSKKGDNGRTRSDAAGCDSDETIEMTEEEIDLAFKTVSSKLCE